MEQHIKNQLRKFDENLKSNRHAAVQAPQRQTASETRTGDYIIPADLVNAIGVKVIDDLVMKLGQAVGEAPPIEVGVKGYADGGMVFNDKTAAGIANTDKAMASGMGGGYSASFIHYDDPKPSTGSAVPEAPPTSSPAISSPATSPPSGSSGLSSVSWAGNPLRHRTSPTFLISKPVTNPLSLDGMDEDSDFSVENLPEVDYADIENFTDPFASSIFPRPKKRLGLLGAPLLGTRSKLLRE